MMLSRFVPKVEFIFFSGKNSKWVYYLAAYWRIFVPCRIKPAKQMIAIAKLRDDYEYMLHRRDYYCKLSPNSRVRKGLVPIRDLRVKGQKVYVLDTLRYARRFNPAKQLLLLPGDITYVPEIPSITKSRPIFGDNANSVLLKLNCVRHFIIVKDRIPFSLKSNIILFRGKISGKNQRHEFMHRWFGHPMVDAGDVGRLSPNHPQWHTHKLTISQQLRHKFIMAIEGNDVASNLKWIMSSNSIAVMPRPTYETWFMEGKLVADYHYIEVKDDFSDLVEKVQYYIDHQDKAEAIIKNANEYVRQSLDVRREELISLMVLDKYFNAFTGGKG